MKSVVFIDQTVFVIIKQLIVAFIVNLFDTFVKLIAQFKKIVVH